MPKTIDQRLIAALSSNARLSTSELARRLDVSRATIQSRMTKLEAEGLIQGYTVVLGEEHQQHLIHAHVLLKVEQRRTASLNRRISELSEITAMHAISGDFDLILEIRAAGTRALNQLLDQLSAMPGVSRTQTSVILETKFRRTAH